MFGLSEEAILKMLKRNLPDRSMDLCTEIIHDYLIPNIVEVIAANNEAILFTLQDSGSTYDSKY